MKKRGTALLEFMLIFPAFIILILFTVDMGRLILLSSALSDSTHVATRAVAQHGFVGSAAQNNGNAAFQSTIQSFGLFGGSSVSSPTFTVADTNACRRGGSGSAAFVKGTGEVSIDLVTPGLGLLLGGIGGGGGVDGEINLKEEALLRCEITRS